MCATFKFPDFSITNLLMYLKKGVVNLFDLNFKQIELFLKEMHNQLLDMENRRISIKMSEILDI